LAGFGEAKATAIVAYRETDGTSASIDELLEVSESAKPFWKKSQEG